MKPDLPAEARRIESILLKQRKSLIQDGVSRKDIRIKGDSLLVRNEKYGIVVNDVFQKCSLVEDTQVSPPPGPPSPNPPAPSSSNLSAPSSSSLSTSSSSDK